MVFYLVLLSIYNQNILNMNQIFKNNIFKLNQDIETLTDLNTSNKVTVIAVSKNRTQDEISEVITTNLISNFAENYVQETIDKWIDLKAKYQDIKLHLIGHLQTNKVKQALSIFDVIQTIDSEKLAEKIAQYHPINKEFYIQVNLDNNKPSGIEAKNLSSLFTKCKLLNLNVVGLMGMLPETDNPAPYFAFMKNLQTHHNLPFLSMGISNDYKEALKFGTTHIRIGSKIFDQS